MSLTHAVVYDNSNKCMIKQASHVRPISQMLRLRFVCGRREDRGSVPWSGFIGRTGVPIPLPPYENFRHTNPASPSKSFRISKGIWEIAKNEANFGPNEANFGPNEPNFGPNEASFAGNEPTFLL
jgi:hypothetical protein